MSDVALSNRRILVIDDTESIHSDFRKTLAAASSSADLAALEAEIFGDAPARADGPAFEIESAFQGEDGCALAETALAEGRPFAVAFVDMRMPPGWDGIATIERLWQIDPDLQAVICTAYSDYAWDEMVDRLGVSDRLLFLRKPFDRAEVSQLALALTQKWAMARRASMKLGELEAIVEERTAELRHQATHDTLTGLGNRATLVTRLDAALTRRRLDPAHNFATLFLDFDRFKVVNDSLGHDAGDQLLIGIARRMSTVLRGTTRDQGALAVRLGGDEFVVLLEGDVGLEGAKTLADRLLAELARPHEIGEHEVVSTASIGIVTGDGDYASAMEVLRDADLAMYHAKNAGRARYVVFDQTMRQKALRRLQLESDLHAALAREQFSLAYQPIVGLEDARLVGFEALLRWDHPTLGTLPPSECMPIAEDTALIVPIGWWVLREAARQLAEWRRRFPAAADLTINVNLSKRQLFVPNLDERLSTMLDEEGVPPGALRLEVTESVIMRDEETVVPPLRRLREHGFRLCMDDFGAGYSSLSHLSRFPIDVLKIDHSFIKDLSLNRNYAAVVQAIVALAHNLDMLVVAEGVETAEQLAPLQALECDLAQGFLFGRPMTPEEVAPLLATDAPALMPVRREAG